MVVVLVVVVLVVVLLSVLVTALLMSLLVVAVVFLSQLAAKCEISCDRRRCTRTRTSRSGTTPSARAKPPRPARPSPRYPAAGRSQVNRVVRESNSGRPLLVSTADWRPVFGLGDRAGIGHLNDSYPGINETFPGHSPWCANPQSLHLSNSNSNSLES